MALSGLLSLLPARISWGFPLSIGQQWGHRASNFTISRAKVGENGGGHAQRSVLLALLWLNLAMSGAKKMSLHPTFPSYPASKSWKMENSMLHNPCSLHNNDLSSLYLTNILLKSCWKLRNLYFTALPPHTAPIQLPHIPPHIHLKIYGK